MNKKLVLVLLTAGVFLTVDAQVQFGVKAGPNFTTFAGSDAGGAKLLVGLHGGAFVKIPFSDQFSLQPELQYSQQGAKGTDQTTGISITGRTNYLAVPMMLTFTHSSGLILQTGPQVSFLLSASYKAQGTSVNAKDGYKSADVGWATGIGYLSQANVGFIFRYFAGWLNAENTSNSNMNTPGNGTIHNVGFQLSVFYLFGGSDR